MKKKKKKNHNKIERRRDRNRSLQREWKNTKGGGRGVEWKKDKRKGQEGEEARRKRRREVPALALPSLPGTPGSPPWDGPRNHKPAESAALQAHRKGGCVGRTIN